MKNVITGAVILLLIVPPLSNQVFMFQSDYRSFHTEFYQTLFVPNQTKRYSPIITENEFLAYAWIRDNTPQNSIILVAPENWEITAVAGRAVIYSAYRFVLNSTRNNDTEKIYNSIDPIEANLLLEQYSVDYIIVGPVEIENYVNAQKFEDYPEFYELCYNYANITIYRYV